MLTEKTHRRVIDELCQDYEQELDKLRLKIENLEMLIIMMAKKEASSEHTMS